MVEDPDLELQALQKIVEALSRLDAGSRARVLGYAMSRYPGPIGAPPASIASGNAAPTPVSRGPVDIRSLTADKAPGSSIEMAAVVAYYLAELAQSGERRETITVAELEKYFKQANFRLPQNLGMILVHAKNAGYIDQVDRGHYKLNPVGYNLVAFGLPREGNQLAAKSKSRKHSRKAKTSKKR